MCKIILYSYKSKRVVLKHKHCPITFQVSPPLWTPHPMDMWGKPVGFWEASARPARRGSHLPVGPLCILLLLKWRSDIWIIAFYCRKVQIRTLSCILEKGRTLCEQRTINHPSVSPSRRLQCHRSEWASSATPFHGCREEKTISTWPNFGAQGTRCICA